MINLYLGGTRSGKSRRALDEAKTGIFLATAEVMDDEFRIRIQHHKDERGHEWLTKECPLDLKGALEEHNTSDSKMLIDCLTVWLGNLMHYKKSIDKEVQELVEVLVGFKGDVFLVSNEVGQGVVPEHPMGREFRDHQGRLNQSIAAIADRVELLVAGIPLVVKS